jgi:diacylglycerol kinase (ATP)
VTVAVPVDTDARTVLIGVNRRAGAQDRQAIVNDLRGRLVALNFEVQISEDVDRLADESRQLLDARRLRAVVAAGGDGTIRLIADRTPVGTPLLVLPLGTENLLARHLELKCDAEQLARVVAEGLTVKLDAGLAGNQLFTLVAGCGFDAEVVRLLHQSRVGHIHHLSYIKPIIEAVLKYDYPELRVHYASVESPDGADLDKQITARWVFVINLPRYAGGLRFSPQASGTDGLFDVCTFKEGSLWSALLYLGGVMLGQHEGMQDFVRVQTRRARVEAHNGVPYQLDGDPGGELPVEFSVSPARLTMLVAREWVDKHRFESLH